MKQRNKTSHKYLAQYAEPEVEYLASFPAALKYQHVLVIPAFQESVQFIKRFIAGELAIQNCLLIVVINQPDNELGRQHAQHQVTLDNEISQLGKEYWQQGNLRLIDLATDKSNATNNSNVTNKINASVLIVNRYIQPIPAEQGVGLARKIGADLAAQLFIADHITSSWIHSTDADATLPNNYFTAHLPEQLAIKNAVVTCCDFYHHSEQLTICLLYTSPSPRD